MRTTTRASPRPSRPSARAGSGRARLVPEAFLEGLGAAGGAQRPQLRLEVLPLRRDPRVADQRHGRPSPPSVRTMQMTEVAVKRTFATRGKAE